MTNVVDTTSHLSLLDPRSIEENIQVVGCGAIGSQIAYSLAKLGFDRLHLWDFDKVESHNVANQLYTIHQENLPKVVALQTILNYMTGMNAMIHDEKCEHALDGIIFLAVDSMQARQDLFNRNKLRPTVKLIVECRMNPWDGRVYCINPSDRDARKLWEANSSYSDDDAQVEVSACGRNISVGPTARIMAEIAVIQFMRWARLEQNLPNSFAVEPEIIIGMNNWFIE